MPKGRSGGVQRHRGAARALLTQQLEQQAGEPVQRAGRLALAGDHGRQREEGAVKQGEGIQQKDRRRHGDQTYLSTAAEIGRDLVNLGGGLPWSRGAPRVCQESVGGKDDRD